MKLSDIGESGLIQRLDRLVKEAGVGGTPLGAASRLLVGIGDDAAAWRMPQGTLELATTDTMVEGVHFTQQTTPWEGVGWKAMVANLSDIAAMGGVPAYALVTLGLPDTIPVEAVEAMYGGIAQACRHHSASIVGGDIVKSPVFFVTIALTGVHSEGTPMLRSAARPGDLLAVTGPLGSSRAGLELLQGTLQMGPEAADYLRAAHRRPAPRLTEGRVLSEEGVLAAMDISDGLLDDLAKMMLASAAAAQIDSWRVPVHPLLAEELGDRALPLALAGGEDYELLYAAPPTVMERSLARVAGATVIGRVVAGTAGQVAVQDRQGKRLEDLERGWDHFRR